MASKVRRYRNYDGSYTQAGLKRYDKSLEDYNKADVRYKDAKSKYKSAKKSKTNTDVMRTEMVNAKLARKQAKNKLNKDYKHLKYDKLGDQGKALYASGKTITGNNAIKQALEQIGGVSLSAAAYNYQMKVVNNAANIKGVVDYDRNRKLRAYCSHTSSY